MNKHSMVGWMQSNLKKEFKSRQAEKLAELVLNEGKKPMTQDELKSQIFAEMRKVHSRLNEILLVVDMTSMDINRKSEVQLLETLKGFKELNKNIDGCFEDKKAA